jgi:quercetin dioxygenase-like cupin family protein
MQTYELDEFTGGWFVGAFSPAIINCAECEVAIKRYSAGSVEPSHHHKIATELTVVVSGRARMGGTVLTAGMIAEIAKGESTSFEALEDTVTVVVKTPSVADDKYVD